MSETHYPADVYHQYLDQELDAQTHQDFEAHLAGCAACTQQIDSLKLLFAEIGALPEPKFELDLTDKVLSQISYLDTPLPPAMRRISNIQIALSLILLLFSFPLIAQIRLPEFSFILPTIELPVFDVFQLIAEAQNFFGAIQVPQLQDLIQISPLPELPTLGISESILFLLLISTGLLWWFAHHIFYIKYPINGG